MERKMQVMIDVPGYTEDGWLQMEWEEGSLIKTRLQNGKSLVIEANSAGLISLARLFLTLTNDEASKGEHWHLDDTNSLEEGSVELVVVRI